MPDNQADSDSGMMSDRQADSADRPVPCESSERDGIKPERGPQTADTGHRKDRVLNSFSAFHSPSPGPSAISESPLPGADPTDFDILCGKSRDCVGHIGSIRYREYIDTYRERYALCKTKHAKMQIIKEIYHNLSQRCRFLKFNKQIGVWEEVSRHKFPSLMALFAFSLNLLCLKICFFLGLGTSSFHHNNFIR